METAAPLQVAPRLVHRIHGGKALLATGVIEQMIVDNLGWALYPDGEYDRPPRDQRPRLLDRRRPSAGVQSNGALGSDGALLQLAAQLERRRRRVQRFPGRAQAPLLAD